jgi:low affinity Fe/Cu permease
MSKPELFARFAHRVADWSGRPAAFVLAVAALLVWALLGPVMNFNDSWQLSINTATTILTFLMVFIIQNTQNRQGAATQIKLDELLRAMSGAHTRLVDLEDASGAELEELRRRYQRLAERVRNHTGEPDTGTPDLDDENSRAG